VATAALDEFAASAEADPELVHLLDLFRARLELMRGGSSDSWAAAKAHIFRHCRLETAQQPYSLTALKLWVHHSRTAINGPGIIAHTLRGWVEGPFGWRRAHGSALQTRRSPPRRRTRTVRSV
jgi:hypothetical protein